MIRSMSRRKVLINLIERLPIVNGDFNNAGITGWTPQSATISYEVFDGKNAVVIENAGGYTMLKQEVACVIGKKYSVRALVHDNNLANDVGLVVYDGALQNVTINAQHDSLILQAHTAPQSTDWEWTEDVFTAISTMVTVCVREFGLNTARVNEVI